MLCPGLLLACWDKPGPADTTRKESPSASPRSVRAERGVPTDPRQVLRAAAFAWRHALPDEAVHDEAVLAMEKALLQQPQDVQAAWLQTADSKTRSELEAQRGPAMTEIGDNVPLKKHS